MPEQDRWQLELSEYLALQADSLPSESPGKPIVHLIYIILLLSVVIYYYVSILCILIVILSYFMM